MAVKGRDVVPELDEDGREARSLVRGRALLQTDTPLSRVSHVVVGVLGVHHLSVPA